MIRHIDFEGVENFRDFGGYGAAGGRALKTGQLFRSGHHGAATAADLERLRDLGIGAIVDLRRTEERRREPSRRWEGFAGQVIENDLGDSHSDWVDVLRDAEISEQWFFEDSLVFYRRAPFEARHIDLFRRYFRALAEAEAPLVVHCAAGKDRTGLICALTHRIAGVHEDDVLADYLLTNDEARIARRVRPLCDWVQTHVGRTLTESQARVALSVHPAYLETALAEVDARFGSLDGYLEQALGVDDALRERICERVLA